MSDAATEETTPVHPLPGCAIGDLVEPLRDGGVYTALRDGGMIYHCAVVVAVEPFALTSLDGAMLWINSAMDLRLKVIDHLPETSNTVQGGIRRLKHYYSNNAHLVEQQILADAKPAEDDAPFQILRTLVEPSVRRELLRMVNTAYDKAFRRYRGYVPSSDAKLLKILDETASASIKQMLRLPAISDDMRDRGADVIQQRWESIGYQGSRTDAYELVDDLLDAMYVKPKPTET